MLVIVGRMARTDYTVGPKPSTTGELKSSTAQPEMFHGVGRQRLVLPRSVDA